MSYSYHYQCKFENETDIEFIMRMCQRKDAYGLTWRELAENINEELKYNYSESYYRKKFQRGEFLIDKVEEFLNEPVEECITKAEADELCDECTEQWDETFYEDCYDVLLKAKKERVKARDERTQMNAAIRKAARYDSLIDLSKEIAHNMAQEMSGKKFLNLIDYNDIKARHGNKSAILELSDWHYGIDVNSYWNVYNPDVAEERISKLLSETKRICDQNGVNEIWVVNLADLICGRIHLTLRLQSRIDVITQTMRVSEILAEFLASLSNTGMIVHYVGCLDNHSRLEPNKNDSLDLESLARIIDWYLKERLGDRVMFHDNEYSHDIITFNILGYKVAGIHGDKDRPADVVKHITLMTRQQYDLVLTAHLHHFSCDEQNETVVISNGSLMGTDDYAEKLRLSSKPSQNLIIVSEKSVCEALYRIVLE